LVGVTVNALLLYQDEGDFEVAAGLDFSFVQATGRAGWMAFPDWDMIKRDAGHSDPAVTARRVA
jgi:hypothetical protein